MTVFLLKQKSVASKRQDRHPPQLTRRTSSPWTAHLVSPDQSVKVQLTPVSMLTVSIWLSLKTSIVYLSTCLTGPPSMAPDHRKQIDNLKKFSVDFRVSVGNLA